MRIARFIHQAMLRRSVVVKIMETMKRRGHRAYTIIDMSEVITKACELFEHHIPPAIIRLLTLDDLQEEQMQQSATLIPIPVRVKKACAHLDTIKYKAVVNEKSSQDEVYINGQ